MIWETESFIIEYLGEKSVHINFFSDSDDGEGEEY